MPSVIISLSISPNELLKYYQGAAQVVVAQSTTGQRVQLPASILRQFVSPSGIQGCFEIHYSEAGKLTEIVKISS
ncbi:MAG: DUF2835 domain-containing protein [Gammaproteobacteria bacterium]|jgi:hypothetical protein|nr:DUF2835 domain-containing protein [Gammaproteobacteria bacterium]